MARRKPNGIGNFVDFGLAAIIFDAFVQASSLTVEHSRRKKKKAADSLFAAVQSVDIDEITSRLTPIDLANMMGSTIQAKDVKPAIESLAFKNLLKSMFLAEVCDAEERQKKLASESMQIILISRISSQLPADQVECFASKLVTTLNEICREVVSNIRDIDPQIITDLQQAALLKRIASLIENIQPHNSYLRSTNSPEAIVGKQAWVTEYRRLCMKAHGFIVPPDFDSNKKIPMNELYVIPSISARRKINDIESEIIPFDNFANIIDRTVILGDPGGGKSTLSNYLTWNYASKNDIAVPFHITLRDFAKDHDEYSIVEYIESRIRTFYQVPSPPGYVEEMLLSGEAFVVFDGLDELIDTSKRRIITEKVELFGIKYPLSKILVTSRRVGYDQAKLDTDIFQEFLVGEFSENDCATYVKKWFACHDEYSEEEATRRADSFISQSGSVPDLRSNPLMLALMCIIFRGENFIPRNRPAVYEKCSTLLFEKWDGHREIIVPLQAKAYVDEAMKYIAFWMLDSENAESGVHYDKLVSEMTVYLEERAFDSYESSRKAAEEFVDFCKGRAWVFSDAGSTADGDPLFTFTHRTFMEYFAAYHLTRVNITPEKLARTLLPRVAKQEWEVVAQLAVQIKEKSVDQGSELVLTEMLAERRRRSLSGRSNILQFIAECLSFCNVSPKFIKKFTLECLQMLILNENIEARGKQFSVFKPWYELMESTTEVHRGSIYDVHRDFFNETIGAALPGTWKRSCSLVLLGSSLAWEDGIHSSDSTGMRFWQPLFAQVAANHQESLRRFCLEFPAFRPSLILTGLESVSEAVVALKDQGHSFGEVLFSRNQFRPMFFEPISVHRILYASAFALKRNLNIDPNSLLSEFCMQIVLLFRSDKMRRPPKNFNPRIISALPTPPEGSPSFVFDAFFIINLAVYEILHDRFGDKKLDVYSPRFGHGTIYSDLRKARVSSSPMDRSNLQSLSLSDDILDFAVAWSSGEASVLMDQ